MSKSTKLYVHETKGVQSDGEIPHRILTILAF
jgi:hypothetical protein